MRQLRYAIAAADHGGFYRAARTLDVDQSTLSRAILKLERSIANIARRSSARTLLAVMSRRFDTVPGMHPARMIDLALHRPRLIPADEAISAGVMNPRNVSGRRPSGHPRPTLGGLEARRGPSPDR